MLNRYVIIGFLLAAVGAAGIGFVTVYEPKAGPVVDTTDCDSCAARKQNLSKVRQALIPSEPALE